MKQKLAFLQVMFVVLLSFYLSSCSVVSGIFNTGFKLGIFITIVIIIVLIFIIARMGKRS